MSDDLLALFPTFYFHSSLQWLAASSLKSCLSVSRPCDREKSPTQSTEFILVRRRNETIKSKGCTGMLPWKPADAARPAVEMKTLFTHLYPLTLSLGEGSLMKWPSVMSNIESGPNQRSAGLAFRRSEAEKS